jgi:hypothetical protein
MATTIRTERHYWLLEQNNMTLSLNRSKIDIPADYFDQGQNVIKTLHGDCMLWFDLDGYEARDDFDYWYRDSYIESQYPITEDDLPFPVECWSVHWSMADQTCINSIPFTHIICPRTNLPQVLWELDCYSMLFTKDGIEYVGDQNQAVCEYNAKKLSEKWNGPELLKLETKDIKFPLFDGKTTFPKQTEFCCLGAFPFRRM